MSGDGLDWFRAPGPDFRPAVFWFWHRIPTVEEIGRQLADMRAKGVGTVMIQARRALPLESYLSPPYLDAYRLAAAEARRLDLRLTIYDEYGWMSGHGGGHTVHNADHLRERHLFWTSGKTRQDSTELTISNIHSPFLDFLGEAGRTWCYEGGVPRWDDWQVVLAVSHPDQESTFSAESDIRLVTGAVEVKQTGAASCRIVIEHGGTIPAGSAVTVFASARCLTSRLINYLLPEAAERFADAVYAPLLDAASGAADGFFFDHPYAGFHVWDEHHGDVGNSLLWDAADPADAMQLLSLVRDVGPRTAALRASFFEAYGRRMHEAFFGTLSRWTDERGIGFTGHELLTHVGAWGLHAGLKGFDPRSMPGVDYFGIDAYRSMTAVDAAGYAPQLSAKLGDSVARAHGRRRCMIEQYSTGRETGTASLAGQWGLTAERFRAQAIRHLLFGARQILLHAYNVTDGDKGDGLLSARFDFPPAFNFEPWWEDCPAIFAELARLSAFLEHGEPLRPVALLYPLETIRAEAMAPACGEHFGWWAEALARAGLGYDIVDESMLASVLGPTPRYEVLVLPAVTTLASVATAEIIAAFVRSGGRLLATGPLPHKTRTKGEDPSGAVLLTSLAAECGRVVHLPDAGQQDTARHIAAEPRPLPDMRFEDGPSWSSVSRCGDIWRLAAFNDQATTRRLNVRLAEPTPEVSFWNPETGEVGVTPCTVIDGTLSLDVGAQRLVCLSIRNGDPASNNSVDARRRRAAALVDVPAPIVLSEGWTLEIDGGEPIPVAVDRGWEAQGHATFAGSGVYRRCANLPILADGLVWHLLLPGLHETAELWLDGTFVGRHVAGEARFALPVACGEVAIELRVRNTAANRYYAGTPYWGGTPLPSGLTAAPYLYADRDRLVANLGAAIETASR
ncbi:carbohydrate-binding protein (plasmid) [Mesorhizobium sp. AR07]|uniref:carbohydrate-binding protein n=1 Tax=Mesorhizobium sp. AR07 TaxID=2865838 RepID=UPI00215E886F|nr:carbohydrate-binding protein [Mesorhizobium sp. AR07]UVK49575.1 carbohydrate-binding protein [Mesorhizobium sp. AR07]